jgi:uncharacterized protein (DUF1697 family)
MIKSTAPLYIAFLRGVNVGGHKPVRMEALKAVFAAMQFQNIRTILATGNVLFNAPKYTDVALARVIEAILAETFGHPIGVIVRRIEDLKALADDAPFKKVRLTPDSRLYVTYLAEKPTSTLQAPWQSPGKELRIVRITPLDVCSVVSVTPDHNSADAMAFIEKEFGKNVTTRNWNTIEKILKSAS